MFTTAILIPIIISVFVIITVLCLSLYRVKRNAKRKPQDNKNQEISVGMTESQLYSQYGAPDKTEIIDRDTKLYTYFKTNRTSPLDDTSRTEIAVTVKNGIITDISR